MRALLRLRRWQDRVIWNGGGSIPAHLLIDAHKAATGPFVALLMWLYGNTDTVVWVYLGLHGGYGVVWVLKDAALPDRSFRRAVTPAGALAILGFLSLYWVAPFLLVSGLPGGGWDPAGSAALGVAVGLHTLGLALMLAADAHKHAALRHDAGLITTGLFARVRHPNYLGEMLIYGSYALIVDHWLPWLILAAIWTLVFLPNMAAIDASLARYPGWPGYRERTGMLLPKLRR